MIVRLFADHNAWYAACAATGCPRREGEFFSDFNRRAIPALQIVPLFHAAESYRQQAGHDVYAIVCPGCGHQGVLAIEPAPGAEHAWRIAGVPDRITLSPSVDCPCGRPGAHFWVENSRYRPA